MAPRKIARSPNEKLRGRIRELERELSRLKHYERLALKRISIILHLEKEVEKRQFVIDEFLSTSSARRKKK